MVHSTLIVLTAALVFATGSRLCRAQNALLGGITALLFFALHPLVLLDPMSVSAWDGFFSALFFAAWVWMSEWSLFMRSWILAGIYAFGLWVGSSFVFWIPLAMIPWIALNRRPQEALIQFATLVFGGFVLFGAVWGISFLASSHAGRPEWLQWVRWARPHLPMMISWPFAALATEAIAAKFLDSAQSRRSDTVFCLAVLLVFIGLCGPFGSSLAVISLASMLIAMTLVRREFLYQRVVRVIASFTFLATIGFIIFTRQAPGFLSFGLIVGLGCTARWLQKSSILSWRVAFEASCVGAYFASSIGIALLR